MSYRGQPGLPGHNLFVSSIGAIANVAALIIAFFGTAPFYGQTIAHVQRFAARHYAPGYEEIIGWAWLGVAMLFVFFVSRAVTGGVLYLGSVMITRRAY